MLIGELSRRTGASPRALRYYEEQGLLAVGRGGNSYRRYEESAVTAVRQIRALLQAGLSTEVIRDVLPCVRGERPEIDMCVDVRAALGRELEILDEQIEDLRQSRNALAEYLADPKNGKPRPAAVVS